MPLLAGDIRFARSAVMSDESNGGGPPSAQLITDGSSNAIFPDISEDARTGGLVEVRHVHGVLRNTDTDTLLGANIIIAEPSDDPNVSMTLVASKNTFARRPDIVKMVESTSTPGGEFQGFLLDNPSAPMRGIRIGQRPGSEPPAVNTTLVLVLNEGLTTEVVQYVRVRRVTVSNETFTETTGSNGYTDYPIQIATCELFSELKFSFAGSAANRSYARQANKTIVRRVNITDSGTFYGATRLTAATLATDLDVKVASIYTQIVPNTRTETPLIDQRPGAVRTLTLTDSLGTIEVSAASHTDRLLITEATWGYAHTFALRPVPAPGTLAISYLVMGTWYTLMDDGAGNLTGQGSGTVNYSTGSVAFTTEELPDINTPITATWADTMPYTNVCAAGSIVLTQQGPEFQVAVEPGSSATGTVINWVSGGVAKSATVLANGTLSGDATGRFVAAAGKLFIQPTAWIDQGTGFEIVYAQRGVVTQSFSSVATDAGGFAQLTLTDEPVPGTCRVSWYTAQKVSATSGASLVDSFDINRAGSAAFLNNAVIAMIKAEETGTEAPASALLFKESWSYTTTTTSTTNDTRVVKHEVTDDGLGTFGVSFGTANYAGKVLTVHMVDQSSSTTSYQSDYEKSQAFLSGHNSIITS